jgi:hypothetical protein
VAVAAVLVLAEVLVELVVVEQALLVLVPLVAEQQTLVAVAVVAVMMVLQAVMVVAVLLFLVLPQQQHLQLVHLL